MGNQIRAPRLQGAIGPIGLIAVPAATLMALRNREARRAKAAMLLIISIFSAIFRFKKLEQYILSRIAQQMAGSRSFPKGPILAVVEHQTEWSGERFQGVTDMPFRSMGKTVYEMADAASVVKAETGMQESWSYRSRHATCLETVNFVTAETEEGIRRSVP